MFKSIISSLYVLCAGTSVAVGQSVPPAVSIPAQFDVASIRPVEEGGNPENDMVLNLQKAIAEHSRGGTFRVPDINLDLLIQLAYKFKSDQILGEPGWAHSQGYSVDAKAAGDLSFDQMRPMLQTLISERFGLVSHKEVRQQLIYELVPAKNGIKIPQNKVACVTPTLGGPPPPPGSKVCGGLSFAVPDRGTSEIDGYSVPMSRLVDAISSRLGHPVQDETGYAGALDVQLTFSSDTAGGGDSAGSSNPTLAVALKEQLGLELRATKGPVEVFIVDHVERLTSN